jgi:hypothetical protein
MAAPIDASRALEGNLVRKAHRSGIPRLPYSPLLSVDRVSATTSAPICRTMAAASVDLPEKLFPAQKVEGRSHGSKVSAVGSTCPVDRPPTSTNRLQPILDVQVSDKTMNDCSSDSAADDLMGARIVRDASDGRADLFEKFITQARPAFLVPDERTLDVAAG